MFRVLYAGKMSIKQVEDNGRFRTKYGSLLADYGCGFSFLTKQGHKITLESLEETHTEVAQTVLTNPEDIFLSFQGESAPKEFCDAIFESDATHTSMSVGDVLVDTYDGRILFCDSAGWVEVV